MLGWFDTGIHHHNLEVLKPTTSGTTPRGTPITTTVSHVLEGYGVQPINTDETEGTSQHTRTRWRVSGPVTDLVSDSDVVRWNGDLYDVDGDPLTYMGGTLDHTEFVLVRSGG